MVGGCNFYLSQHPEPATDIKKGVPCRYRYFRPVGRTRFFSIVYARLPNRVARCNRVTPEQPVLDANARSLAEMLEKAKQPHDAVYVQTISAMHSTVRWLLGTSTAANSAGFYFAMHAPDHWLTAMSAGLFTTALAATLLCGVLIVRVHANDAEVANLWRKVEITNFTETQDAINAAHETSEQANKQTRCC